MKFIILFLFPVFITAQHDMFFYADVLTNAKHLEHRNLAQDSLIAQLQRHISKYNAIPDLDPPIQVLTSPDSSFQLISWQLMGEEASNETFGLIYDLQNNQTERLVDLSKYQSQQFFGSFSTNRWIGAVYTDIYQHPNVDSIYILFGYNRINPYETLYIFEPISKSQKGFLFGASLFENKDGEIQDRLIWTITNGAVKPIERSDSLQRIVAPNLTTVPFGKTGDRMVHVPDGTYNYWEWDGNIWRYNDRLYEQKFQDVIIDSTRLKQPKRDLFGRKQ